MGPLTLLDASLQPLLSHNRAARIALKWTAPEAVTEELKISARLLDGAGEVVAAQDAVPVHFTYSATAWVPGETVDDSYDLTLPASAPPGQYSALIILYRAADGGEHRVQPHFDVPGTGDGQAVDDRGIGEALAVDGS
jgi:hypothetical protein